MKMISTSYPKKKMISTSLRCTNYNSLINVGGQREKHKLILATEKK